jgi:hypothetical protein
VQLFEPPAARMIALVQLAAVRAATGGPNSVNGWNIFRYITFIAWNKFHLFQYYLDIGGK